MEYTKGKWTILENEDLVCIEPNGHIEHIATLARFDLRNYADVHLLVSASGFYEALKGLALAYGIDEHSIIVNQDPLYWQRALEALAEAEIK